MKTRPNWDDICMNIAIELANRSLCKTPNRKVGCVIVPPDYSAVSAWGYNGGPSGIDDTCDFNPDVSVGSRCSCAHAEMNAISKLDSTRRSDLIMYVTLQPCMLCATLIINTKSIAEIVYLNEYRDEKPLFILRTVGIKIRKLKP
jgi:dCMP deaminase